MCSGTTKTVTGIPSYLKAICSLFSRNAGIHARFKSEMTKARTSAPIDNKPYTITHFIEGQPIEKPDYTHQQQLIQKAAELQLLTQRFSLTVYTPSLEL